MAVRPPPLERQERKIADAKPLYSKSEAETEALRCLYCVDAPCVAACPTGIDIPTFIRKIATGNVRGSAKTILSENLLGYSCARVCPVEVLCAGACVMNAWERAPIAIGRLQRYSVERALMSEAALLPKKPKGPGRVALVGAGPASLAAAGLLALEGRTAVVFERSPIVGGLNTLGIAPYKMHAEDALREAAFIASLGVELRAGVAVVAKPGGPGEVGVDDLLRDYDAVVIGVGLGGDARLGVPGEDGPGVVGATTLIARIKSDPTLDLSAVKRALVIGGGNTAIDAAHELNLLGVPDVAMAYRRSEAEMSGYAHELQGARKHGVRFMERLAPLSIVRDAAGALVGVDLAPTKDGKPSGPATTHACDLVVTAVGQAGATKIAAAFPGVVVDAKGRVVVDPKTHRTGHAKVWAAGDCVNGGMEVVNAVAEAKLVVKSLLPTLGA